MESVVFAGDGFVEVLDNRVIMVTESAEAASDIDVERARQAEEAARARLLEGQSLVASAAEASFRTSALGSHVQ